jgi:CHAT domain-containing protein
MNFSSLFSFLSTFAFVVALPFAPLSAQEGDAGYQMPEPRDQTDAMFQLAQRVQGAQAALAVQQIALRMAARAQGAEDLAIARRDLSEARSDIAADPGQSDAERAIRLDEIDAQLSANADALAKGFPQWREITAPAPVTLDEAQSLLAPDEALIFLHQGPDQVFLWLIAKNRVIWHRVGIGREDAPELVAMFRHGMGLGPQTRGAAALDDADEDDVTQVTVPEFHWSLASNLYQLLFGSIDEVLAEYPHLRLVADGPWVGMPFAALITDYRDANAEHGATALRKASWLARRHALTMMPSVVSLRALRADDAPAPMAAPRATKTRLLAIGDPLFSGRSSAMALSRSAGGGVVDVSTLAPLPGTRREVLTIARHFPNRADLLLGAEASEGHLRRSNMDQADVIVFATHGLIAGELQGLAEPALALTPPAQRSAEDDGLLTAGEVAGLTLRAEWVVLSACNTAAGDGQGAEGLSGLARAFFAAGARALLVSHWPVRDDAAARLTAGAFARMQATPGLRRAEALRLSMLEVMQDEADPSLSHPLAWAPFFVVDGGQ